MSKPVRKKAIRDIPAYQEYASDVLANLNWRMMSFTERGIWDTLRKECWVNGSIPSKPEKLARLLNKDLSEVNSSFTNLVKVSFSEKDGTLTCPELDLYKADRLETRRLQSEGGSMGGLKTQANIRKKNGIADDAIESTNRQANLKVLSRSEPRRIEVSSNDLSSNDVFTDTQRQWLQDYDKEEGSKN